MEKDEFKFKGITIRQDQIEFIDSIKALGGKFNLSKFVQVKIDDWIKFMKETQAFTKEVEVNEVNKVNEVRQRN